MTDVLIDGHALSDGSELRGVGTYLRRVITGLTEHPEFSIRVLAERGVELPPRVRPIAMQSYLPARVRWREHDLLLPRAISRNAGDVFFSPAQHPPRRSPIPWVQTLHDLIPVTRPHPVLEADRRRWLQVGPRLRDAAAVVAVSRFSAEEGIRRLGLDPKRVHVIANGVDLDTFHPDGAVAQRETPYLLHVAAWGPHKGFDEALGVAAGIADAGLPHRLVLAGPYSPWMRERVQERVSASSQPDRADIAGFVPELPPLYRGAAALLMTSRCEGFGFPAVEAMACGTPVIAFANSSLPEVVGDGGILVEDGDVEAMVRAVARVVRDDELRDDLRLRAIAQAGRFRWDSAVEAYAQLLRSVSE